MAKAISEPMRAAVIDRFGGPENIVTKTIPVPALEAVRSGGRIAYPNGVQIQPPEELNIESIGYNGEPDADILSRLNGWIDRGPVQAHIAQTFPLERAAEAHRALEDHYLGKIALQVKGQDTDAS